MFVDRPARLTYRREALDEARSEVVRPPDRNEKEHKIALGGSLRAGRVRAYVLEYHQGAAVPRTTQPGRTP
jgi:hypothetical protein